MSKRDPRVKIYSDVHALARWLAPQRAAGRTLVTTNGCFDVLHAGHVQYLYEAAALGDLLVVGVNCDEVVRRSKGAGRPLQPQADRCRAVAALEMVDGAFIFCEDDPRAFLQELRPQVHVKGGDYDPAAVIERAVVEAGGGVVKTVSYLADRSTSVLAKRLAGDGAAAPERSCG